MLHNEGDNYFIEKTWLHGHEAQTSYVVDSELILTQNVLSKTDRVVVEIHNVYSRQTIRRKVAIKCCTYFANPMKSSWLVLM